MKLYFSLLCYLMIFFNSQAQNLISNGNFETSAAELNCTGWENAVFSLDGDLCDDNPFWLIDFSNDTPNASENWSIALRADFPGYGGVKTFVTGIIGTHIYELTFYAKTFDEGGDISASIGLDNQLASFNSPGFIGNHWQKIKLIDTLTTVASDSIVINLSTAPADLCSCGAFFDVVELRIIDTLFEDDCSSNHIILPYGSIQQGNYRTTSIIESSGSIVGPTKFKATKGVNLLNGFSAPINQNFEANNKGCDFNIADWQIANLDPYGYSKIYLPDTYESDVFWGDDTWIFRANRSDYKVNFSYEEGLGNQPLVLTEPLPENYNGYAKRTIFSADFNDVNGVLLYKTSNASAEYIYGIYLRYNGFNYTQVFNVSYASSAELEVIAILENLP